MNTLAKIQIQTPAQTETLRECCLLTNGNSHRADLLIHSFNHDDLLCEALLPEIRTVATLIAAERHDFNQPSPSHFTDEADWFAARIIVLNVRFFHLEISLLPMLKMANQRAEAFARAHGLPFQPANIRAGLHTRRPANMLLMECALDGTAHMDWIHNTQAVKSTLMHLPKLKLF